MSLRYEITPGLGLVARHGDSVLWVGSDLAPEAWDALGAVLDVIPGTDPTGAETAASLESLAAVLREHPATVFAALIVAEGHAQGILRGPVTVCNTTAVAPATGYEQFGITVPFEMSEAVYVGNVEASGNHPSIAQLFDLDAGVVPGGGAWVHPITSGHRYASGASGTHSSVDTGARQSPASTPTADAEAIPAADQATEASPATEANPAAVDAAADQPAEAGTTAEGSPPDHAVPDEVSAGGVSAASATPAGTGQAEPPGPSPVAAASGDALPLAQNEPGATQMYTRDDHEDASAAPWQPTSEPSPPAETPAPAQSQTTPPEAPPAAPPIAQSAEGGAAPTPRSEQPASGDREFGGASSNDLPSLSAPPSPWAMPDVAAGSETTAGAFTPSEDHLQIDLRAVTPNSTAQPLPLIPTSTSGAQSAAQRSSVLVFDDGSTFALDHDYVIGRRPERHELVQSGQARPLTVVDPDTVLSGAHAALRLHGDQVYLEDLGSLNGSHIARPGATDWTRVEPFTPERLEPGTRLLFGWTVATYSGGHNQA